MKDVIASAIAARLGDVADAAFRLKAAVEAGQPAHPFSLLRMAVDADAAATLLQGHVEKLATTAGTKP
jgi:hypothetical protein